MDSYNNARSDAAKNKNMSPCTHCQHNRQKCYNGYPCYYCAKHKRAGCMPRTQTTFIQVNPTNERIRPSPSESSMEAQTSENRTEPGRSGSTAQNTNNQASSTSGYPILYIPPHLAQRQTFGLMQFVSPSGVPDGFVESFIHEHNGTAYYGARYYDAHGRFLREEFCLSRVSPGDAMQMLPPLPTSMPFAGQSSSAHNALGGHDGMGQYRRT